MFVLLLLSEGILSPSLPPPLPLYSPITLDVRENVWVEMSFIIFSIMFGSIALFMTYYLVRKTVFGENIKRAFSKNEKNRLQPLVRKIKKPKIDVVISKT